MLFANKLFRQFKGSTASEVMFSFNFNFHRVVFIVCLCFFFILHDIK